MAEAISIPSPSVFLRNSPPPDSAEQSSRQEEDLRPAPKSARRQGAATKKAPARKPSAGTGTAAVEGSSLQQQKPKQSKSRNGCITCKTKRLKCGEEKPGCKQCAKRKVTCGGYKKAFKWRPFEETTVKVNIDRQKRASPPRAVANSRSISGSPAGEDGADKAQSSAQATHSRNDSCTAAIEGIGEDVAKLQLPRRQSDVQSGPNSPPQRRPPAPSIPEEPEPGPPPEDAPSRNDRARSASVTIRRPSSQSVSNGAPGNVSQSYGGGASPTLTEILMPFAGDVTEPNADFVPFCLPEDLQLPMPDASVFDQTLNEPPMLDDDIEEIMRTGNDADETQQAWAANYDFSSFDIPDLDMHSPIVPWTGPVNYLYSQPYFAQDSPEMLTFRFDKLTCGILSVFDGQNENPWRTLVWPLALQSPALYHAVMAMTAFHSSVDVPQLRNTGAEHKFRSLQYINQGISDRSMTDHTAIATALALGFAESWDQHTASGNTHIKGAQVLVKRALSEHQFNPLAGVELARLKFLVNAWIYMDVIARLTAVDSDESHDFDNAFIFSGEPQMVMGGNGMPPGFGIDFGMPIDARLDPLMGCANTLFPIIGRAANLVRKVCRSMNTSPVIISAANDLKLTLETWEPPTIIEPPDDPTSQVQHTLQTAEAYRWATLLHLHRSVPELPMPSSADLAQKVLSYLATVPLASRTVIVQIYPLMVAGCEAVTAEDRQWVRDRWTAMASRMRIGVIDKSALVTEEVWRRKDAYEAQPSSSRRLVATSELQPVRKRGEPLKRTHEGFEDADPGRKGVVYSWVDEPGQSERSRERMSAFPPRPKIGLPANIGKMDPAYTVRGHLHWVGVMWDWGWEVLLG